MKTISELKLLIKDGMKLRSDSGEITIRRFPNNIIMMHGKSISWIDFQDLLINGTYRLVVNEDQQDINFKQSGRGGRRFGSGRKTIVENQKNKVRSFSLSPNTNQILDTWLAENNDDFYEDGKQKKMTASLIIDRLIRRNLK